MNYFDAHGFAVMDNFQRAEIAVLVVEDEPILRFDVIQFVEEAGFKVYEASDADEAIGLLEQYEDIRFLFTDFHMPGSMDGIKLAHYVRGRWPPVKIIITSGHPKPPQDHMPTETYFLGKPYRAEHLTRQLHKMKEGIAGP